MPIHLLSARKTPRQTRSAATVDAILEAAAHILEERGLAGYNTNAVAERAGASIGSLYQYFPNKQALTAALIQRDHRALLAALGETITLHQSAPLKTIVSALADVAVGHQIDRPRLARLLDIEEDRLPLSDQSRITAREIVGLIATVLRDRDRELRIEDPEEAATDLLAIGRGLIDMAGQGEDVSRARLRERVACALMGYLEQRSACRLPVADHAPE